MQVQWMLIETLIKDHGATFLMAASIVTTLVVFVKWIGRRASKFVNDAVLPSIKETSNALIQLTGSVEHLSVRTQENTKAIEAMSQDQQRVNLEHATAIAHLEGKIGK